jgi:uncharacterized membrane protein
MPDTAPECQRIGARLSLAAPAGNARERHELAFKRRLATGRAAAGDSRTPNRLSTFQLRCAKFGTKLNAVRMNRMSHGRSLSAANPSARLVRAVHGLVSVLALASFALVMFTLFVPLRKAPHPEWPMAVLIVTTTFATMVAYTRRLPLQNVVLAAGVIGLMGGAVHAVGAATAIPFGPFSYTDSAGPRIFGTLAWPIPFVWIIVILNSRDVARLVLRPWRKLRSYGFWLMGITVSLAVLFDLALEPFAASVKHYWLWHPTRLPLTWGGAPVTNFLGWLVTALLTLAFATPALIDKRQQRSANRPPNYHPLVVWLLAVALLGVGAATHQLWPAVIYCIAAGFAVVIFAIRGAKW